MQQQQGPRRSHGHPTSAPVVSDCGTLAQKPAFSPENNNNNKTLWDWCDGFGTSHHRCSSILQPTHPPAHTSLLSDTQTPRTPVGSGIFRDNVPCFCDGTKMMLSKEPGGIWESPALFSRNIRGFQPALLMDQGRR